MSDERWDLVVIGSGGAGMAAAIEARRRDARVLVVERATLGGTCLNVGCIPSKRMLAAGGHRQRARQHPFAGVPTAAGEVILGPLVTQKDELVEQLRRSKYLDVAQAHGFAIRPGTARFVAEDALELDGRILQARAFVLATGAEPRLPSLPGLAEVDHLTSTTAMALTALPASMVVVGGGDVGAEQAQLWSQLGVEVTLVGTLAPQAEPEVADVLRDAFARDGIRLVEQRAVAVGLTRSGVAVRTDDGQSATAERLLMATGRAPVTAGLGLDAALVRLDAAGAVGVDREQRTTNPRVFAAGDVAGGPQHVYVAAATGRAAAAGALGDPQKIDPRGLPRVTFTTPQLASVGLTEAQAIAAGHRCECRVLDAHDIPRALVDGRPHGVLKLVADSDTGQVLGVHAALDAAGELVLAATYAIRHRLTVDDLADTWAPYLTMGEALRLAAGLFRGDLPTSCCA